MGNCGIQRDINQTTDADYQKKRYHIINKLAKTTANNNKQDHIGQQDRPIRKHKKSATSSSSPTTQQKTLKSKYK